MKKKSIRVAPGINKDQLIRFPAEKVKESEIRPIETKIIEHPANLQKADEFAEKIWNAEFVDDEWPDIIGGACFYNPARTLDDVIKYAKNLQSKLSKSFGGVQEIKDGYKIEVELPRFDLADIKVRLGNDKRSVYVWATKQDDDYDYGIKTDYLLYSEVKEKFVKKLKNGVLYLEFKKL